MLTHLTVLLIGYTIFSAASLIFAYSFYLHDLQKSIYSKVSCVFLLIGLASLQGFHYLALTASFDPLNHRFYLLCLLIVPAFFYYFSRFVLFPSLTPQIKHLIHIIPLIVGLFLPHSVIPAIAFLIGSGYCLWFIHLVLKLRTQQNRFAMERFFFGMFAIFAIIALVLGLMIPYIDETIFYTTYASSIGIAMLLVTTAIIVFPEMLSDIQLLAERTYINSKLNGVDVAAKKDRLEELIQQESIFQNEKLSLSHMAELLDLSPHQLSELINSEYGYGFSRFVRSHRIEQAKKLLVLEPKTSILAISIMTGFQSQSNFYSAFKEVTEESPGNYRKSRIQQ
ncbi:MAG: helix-turn-helix domain-containing protein [Marinicellaceae bacterium]